MGVASLSPIFADRPQLADLYMAMIEQYGGVGSTPRTALEGIADDLKHGRLTTEEALDTLSATRDEVLVTVAYLVEHYAQWASDNPLENA